MRLSRSDQVARRCEATSRNAVARGRAGRNLRNREKAQSRKALGLRFVCPRGGDGMRVYLDNCCYNRPFDDQAQIKVLLETLAKLDIQQRMKKWRVGVCMVVRP